MIALLRLKQKNGKETKKVRNNFVYLFAYFRVKIKGTIWVEKGNFQQQHNESGSNNSTDRNKLRWIVKTRIKYGDYLRTFNQ